MGAVLLRGVAAPKLITRVAMLATMRPCAVPRRRRDLSRLPRNLEAHDPFGPASVEASWICCFANVPGAIGRAPTFGLSRAAPPSLLA